MYHLIKIINLQMLRTEIPAFFCSLFLAESLYNFHNFTLELFAFLGTYYFLSYSLNFLLTYRKKS